MLCLTTFIIFLIFSFVFILILFSLYVFNPVLFQFFARVDFLVLVCFLLLKKCLVLL